MVDLPTGNLVSAGMSPLLQGGECVEAHTNVDVVVDLEEFRGLLDSRLPLVFKGASVEEAEIEWPGRGFNISSPFQATS